MKPRTHPALSLVLSLVLMIFSICQAQARAQLPGVATPHAGTAPVHHHDMTPDAGPADHAGHAGPVADCHGDCLQQQPHPDAGTLNLQPDASPGLLAVLPALSSPTAALSRALAYHPPSARDADPPPVLRFQRFLN